MEREGHLSAREVEAIARQNSQAGDRVTETGHRICGAGGGQASQCYGDGNVFAYYRLARGGRGDAPRSFGSASMVLMYYWRR